MKRSNLLIGFYLVLIFASGIVVGAFVSRLYKPPAVSSNGSVSPRRQSPEEWRHQYVTELRTRLNLTDDQLTKLNQVLDEIGTKVHGERARHSQEMKSIREEHVSRVRAILTDEQRPVYEKWRQEREQRNKAQSAARK
jgi:hypothetical protein